DMCGLLRYMTAAHRVDAIQARLSDVAFVKQWSILRSLKAKYAAMVATAKCLKVEVEHGVSALECFKNHGDGNGESQIIKRGLELVVDTELTRYRTQVEQHCKDVHELGLQRDELGPSGKDTRAMSKAIKAKLRQIRQLLDEMAHYQVLGSIQPPATARVTEEQLQAMVRDEPAPWAGESATTSLGKLLYYGRQLHQLLSDRDRCKEQLAVLRLSMVGCWSGCGS
ncbi:hypothetical protein QJQ45_014348, partial [Haematococcus lacustris]